MRYFIGYLIKGEAREYQENLIDRISEKFDVRNLNGYIPAHFTLKSPFETENISQIEKLLRDFSQKEASFNIKINSIGHFDRRVIYLNGESSQANKTSRKLIKELRKINWMKFHKYDLVEDNFHSTLARAKSPRQFEDIMNFLSEEKPDFDLRFDNITIFQKGKENWEVYREFLLE